MPVSYIAVFLTSASDNIRYRFGHVLVKSLAATAIVDADAVEE
jgi:hypothetical protein